MALNFIAAVAIELEALACEPPVFGAGATLVAFDIDSATFTNDGVDAVVAMAIEEYARAEGRVTHFVVTSALQEPLVDGKVGVRRDGRVLEEGDMYLNRVDMLPGDKVAIKELVIRFRTQA